jgi:hypothetical protein
MNAGTLHDAIDDVCPIVGVSVGKSTDRSTWTYEPRPEATQAQKDAANNVIATIPIETLGWCTAFEFIGKFTDAEYALLEKKRNTDAAADKVGISKMWDLVTCIDIVNMNKTHVQELKAALVSANILTQARANEIFGGNPAMKTAF